MIRKYLKNMATITSGTQSEYFSWLLENGTKYTEQIESKKPTYVKLKRCYDNSMKYSFNENVDYVEGFYITDIVGFPFEHAFNLKDGNVIDVTSSKFGFKVVEWFGIVLSNDIIFEYQMSDCPEWITTLQYYFYTHIKKQKIWKEG